MTSAARPTFLPAMGGYSLRDTKAGPITLKSAKDLNAHMKMKFRREDREIDEKELKELLKQRELEHKSKTAGVGGSVGEKYKEIEDLDKESDDDDEEEDQEDSDSDEDDTEELMRELEKIKQERQQEKDKKELEKEAEKQKMMEERAISGNPLIQQEFGVKRRWDSDVIFKNQSRGNRMEFIVGVVEPKKRFINDMLRSDFHRKFMDKYVK
jgi:protein CWC15